MINKNKKDTVSITIGGKIVNYVCYGAKLVYEAILSCFGKGYWVNNAPFLNDDAWRNN